MKHEPSTHRQTDGPMNKHKRKEVDKVRKAERINISLEMRKQGYNLTDIAESLQVTAGTVRQYLKEGLAIYNEMNLEVAQSYQGLQVQRVEEMLKTWRPIAMDTSQPEVALPALDRVTRLEAQLMKLLGTEGLSQKEESAKQGAPTALVFVGPNNFTPPTDQTKPPIDVVPEKVEEEDLKPKPKHDSILDAPIYVTEGDQQ